MGRVKLAAAFLLTVCLAVGIIWLVKTGLGPARQGGPAPQGQAASFAGTASCRECHEKFYKLWAPSHHGLAMQPFTSQFAQDKIVAQTAEIVMGKYRYRAEIEDGRGWVRERGPQGEKKYPMEHALGGKNVYYFLTPLARGRLQVLPVAFDVRKKEWFHTTASMIRHFSERMDEALDWREPPLTFNAACYSCHVSQVSTNYDLKTDTYQTVWAEPGINCETCHGPGGEHNRVCKEAPEGQTPKDLKIIRGGKDFTAQQNNATCAPCHAKMVPLTTSFQPGERYFDHYDLITLEDPDFSPDGRDLGENYTYTLWLTSPCAKSGKLSCLHCHTSSGRYRFAAADQANNACLPCHQDHVKNSTAHTHHQGDNPGNKCISCHMPMTEFARMRRSDHSMRPPTPGATIAFKSPNACNLCKTDRDAHWADKWVRQWRERDYQGPVLHRAALIQAARKRDWSRLAEMLQYLTSKDRDEVYAASLIRLLEACQDERKWAELRRALKDPSPLVRSAATSGLAANLTPETRDALLAATGDDYRLVRIRAAAALAGYPRELLSPSHQRRLESASAELMAALQCRPDDWTSHYNLGNYSLERGELQQAWNSFDTAAKLQPASVMPLVNGAIVQARLGQVEMAEKLLQQALKIEPANPAANFNLGLLLAERGKIPQAERSFLAALKTDPNFPEAAYNLGVLLARDRLKEAIEWCRKAHELHPQEPKYAYTLAFFLNQKGDPAQASLVLLQLIKGQPAYANAYALLGLIYEKQGKVDDARAVYRQALAIRELPGRERDRLEARLRALSSPEKRDN